MYRAFQQKADKVKNDFLAFLIEQKRVGKLVAAYGGGRQRQYIDEFCRLKTDLISLSATQQRPSRTCTCPAATFHHPAELAKRKPDWVVILPWNISAEVMQQHEQIKTWGGKFVVAVPELKVLT